LRAGHHVYVLTGDLGFRRRGHRQYDTQAE
jgi:hypothetical protein